MKPFILLATLFFLSTTTINAQTVSASLTTDGLIELSIIDVPTGVNEVEVNFSESCNGDDMFGCLNITAQPRMDNIVVTVGSTIVVTNISTSPLSVFLAYSMCTQGCTSPELDFNINGQSPTSLIPFATLENAVNNFENLMDMGTRLGDPTEAAFVFQCTDGDQQSLGQVYHFNIQPQINSIDSTSCQANLAVNWSYIIYDGAGLVSDTFPLGSWCDSAGVSIDLNGNSSTVIAIPEGHYLIFYNCSAAGCRPRACTDRPILLCTPSLNLDYHAGTDTICNTTSCLETANINIQDVLDWDLLIKETMPTRTNVVGKHTDEFLCLTTDNDTEARVEWNYEVINRGADEMTNLYIRLLARGDDITAVSDITITPSGSSTAGLVCPDSSTMPNLSAPCNNIPRYLFFVDRLLPGDSVSLHFFTKRCGDIGKRDRCKPHIFNAWRIDAFSFCDNTCLEAVSGPDCQSVGMDNASCSNGQNLLCVKRNFSGRAIGSNTQNPSFQFDLTTINKATNIVGDVCFNGGKTNAAYQIELDGDAHTQIGPDRDIFDLLNDSTQHLVRMRMTFDEGLALNTCPRIVSRFNQNRVLNPVRIIQHNDTLLDCTVCTGPQRLIADSCNRTYVDNLEARCADTSLVTVDCGGYGQIWDIYFLISNSGLNDPDSLETTSDLEVFMKGLLEFNLTSACVCITDGNNQEAFQIDFDMRPYRDDSMSCGTNIQTAMFSELEPLTWLPLNSIGKTAHAETSCSIQALDVSVQCPGCVTPGAIACNYKIERTTFGEFDADNDGVIDSCGTSSTEPAQGMYKNRSMHGDTLRDELQGYFSKRGQYQP